VSAAKQDDPKKRRTAAFPGLGRYASIGFELAASIIGPTLVGVWIDYEFETSPIWTLVGAAIGIVGGFYNFIREAMQLSDAGEVSRPWIIKPPSRNQPHTGNTSKEAEDARRHDGKSQNLRDDQQSDPPSPGKDDPQ
jgi:F0F1-type ATP synthase assembly protein I